MHDGGCARRAKRDLGSHDDLRAQDGRYAAMWEAFELVGGPAT